MRIHGFVIDIDRGAYGFMVDDAGLSTLQSLESLDINYPQVASLEKNTIEQYRRELKQMT